MIKNILPNNHESIMFSEDELIIISNLANLLQTKTFNSDIFYDPKVLLISRHYILLELFDTVDFYVPNNLISYVKYLSTKQSKFYQKYLDFMENLNILIRSQNNLNENDLYLLKESIFYKGLYGQFITTPMYEQKRSLLEKINYQGQFRIYSY